MVEQEVSTWKDFIEEMLRK
ncbi:MULTISPECIES: protein YpfM [Yersiniaceae]|uniref:Protein YpfM n=1 Tax=Nissabacter archeti TaxID=1917880 RepID=A0ABS5JKM5_9GAMM|nr:protein YpfM [Nissabacter archeti]